MCVQCVCVCVCVCVRECVCVQEDLWFLFSVGEGFSLGELSDQRSMCIHERMHERPTRVLSKRKTVNATMVLMKSSAQLLLSATGMEMRCGGEGGGLGALRRDRPGYVNSPSRITINRVDPGAINEQSF